MRLQAIIHNEWISIYLGVSFVFRETTVKKGKRFAPDTFLSSDVVFQDI